MTKKEIDTIQAIIALSTGCHMLRELCDEVRYAIPDDLQDSFIQLKMLLDDMRNPIFDSITNRTSMFINKEESI